MAICLVCQPRVIVGYRSKQVSVVLYVDGTVSDGVVSETFLRRLEARGRRRRRRWRRASEGGRGSSEEAEVPVR